MVQVQLLHLLARPRRAPQELEAGADARVVREAADRHRLAHGLPAERRDQIGEDLFEGEAVEGVAGLLGVGHLDPWLRQERRGVNFND